MALPIQIKTLVDQIQDKKIPTVKAGKVKLGYLYLMGYNPKLKNKLPYYDILPMFFVLARYNDRILGVNIHYLPYTFRVNLAERLMRATKNKNRISYGDLKSAWKAANIPIGFAMMCIRSYLFSHIVSEIKEFDWETYKIAVQNVMPRFRKEQEMAIYREIIQGFYAKSKGQGLKPKWTKTRKK